MAFTVDEFRDLVRLLEQRPEWRAEVRRLVLTEELLQLPGITRELAAAQGRTEVRLAELAAAQQATELRLEQLAAAQQRTEVRLEQLAAAQQRTEVRLAELAAAQQATNVRLEELAAAQQRTEGELRELAASVRVLDATVGRMDDQLGRLRGESLEARYRNHAGAYFGRLLARCRVLGDRDLADLLDDALEAGTISDAARHEILLADLVLRGRRRTDGQDLYLVVEVSAGIGPGDVRRAADRATFLSAIHAAEPVVAGERITPAAADLAEVRRVRTIVTERPDEGAEP